MKLFFISSKKINIFNNYFLLLNVILSWCVVTAAELHNDVGELDQMDVVAGERQVEIPLGIVSAYATLDTIYERVIGLGRNCLTKAQINLYFDRLIEDQSKWEKVKPGQADIFDWMEITNYDLFAQALSNKLENFFEKDDFAVTEPSHYELRNLRYEMRWVYILSKYLKEIAEDKKNDPESLLETFLCHYEDEKTKINYLKEKFIRAKAKKTLYIISCVPMPSLETLIKVRDGLTIIRDEDKQFSLLVVSNDNDQETQNFENIIIRKASNVNASWKVEPDPLCWESIFSELKFSADIWSSVN